MPWVVQRGRTRPAPFRGTGRAEDVSRLGSLIFRGCGAGAASGPAPRDLVLLSDPAPHRGTRSLGACRPPPARSPPSGRGRLFKSGDRRLALRVMARAGRELAVV